MENSNTFIHNPQRNRPPGPYLSGTPTVRRREALACGTHAGGFTLIELLIVIAIIGILASMLLPALSRARESGRSAVCVGNLQQMGIAVALYADTNDDWMPGGYFQGKVWQQHLLGDYLTDKQGFYCPSEPKAEASYWNWSYGLNYATCGYSSTHAWAKTQRRSAISSFGGDSNLILIADSVPRAYLTVNSTGSLISRGVYPNLGPGRWYAVYLRHSPRANTLMFDGHVDRLGYAELMEKSHWSPRQFNWDPGELRVW